jgi:hypothetical protein
MKYLNLTAFLLLFCVSAIAQTGPGGVGNKDGTGSQPTNVLWLKANSGITVSGSLVDSWEDQSGNFNHATSTGANRPTRTASNTNLNNQATISFPNTTNDYKLEIPDNDNLDNSSALTILYVLRPSATTLATVVAKRTGAGLNQSYVIGLSTGPNRFRSTFGTNTTFDAGNYAANTNYIHTNIVSTTTASAFLNGPTTATQTGTSPNPIPNTASNLIIGDDGAANNFTGDIAEIIIFKSALTRVQRQIVENYLSSKYNVAITIDSFAGDTPANGDYDQDVFGIGQQSGTDHLEGEAAGLVFSEANGSLDADGDFLLAGHKTTTNSVLNSGDAGASLGTGVQQRWARTWYIDKTGTLDANIAFDFSQGIGALFPQNKNNYVLLRFNSGTSTYDAVAIADADKSIVGDRIIFRVLNANLTDGIYTLGTTNSTASPVAGVSVKTWYSYQSGNWTNALSWTLDGGSTPLYVNPSNATPASTDNVIITSGRIITANTNNLQANSIQVDGTLDVGITTGHSFTTITGNGIIRIAGSNDNFPTGDATGFVNASIGGTVEVYGTGLTFNTARTFNNLIINMDGGGGPAVLAANVTLNGNFTVTNGIFRFGDNSSTTNRTLTILKNLSIQSTGQIQVGTGNARHELNLSGNFSNTGGTALFTNRVAANYSAEATDGIVDVNFVNATSDQTVLLEGVTRFYRIEINKGVDDTYKVSLSASSASNFSLFGYAAEAHGSTAQLATNSNALGLIYGTVEIGANISIPVLSTTDNYNISAGAQLWVNGGSVNKDQGNSLVPYGKIRVTLGTLSADVESGVTTRDNGTIIVEGGTLTTRQIRTSVNGPSNVGGYLQSGGTTYVTGGNTNEDYANFSMTYTGNVFSMSGGTLEVYGAVLGSAGNGNNRGAIFINSDPANVSVTGGTVICRISNNNNFRITSRAPFWNLTMTKTAGTATTVELLGTESGDNNVVGTEISLAIQPLVVYNDMLIQNNVTFQTNSANVNIGGNLEIANGSSYVPGTNITTFDRSGVASITFGNTTSTQVWPNVTVSKTNDSDEVVIASGAATALQVTGALRVEQGIFDYGSSIVSATGSVYLADVVGKAASTGKLLMNGSSAQSLTSSSGFVYNFDINNTNGVALTGDITVLRTLTLTNGVFNIGTYKLTLDGANASIAGSPFSATKMIQTAGNASDGGLEMYFDANETIVFPVGTNANATVRYTPARAALQSFSDNGYIQINPVDDILQTTNLSATPAADILSYYWRVRHRSFTTLPKVSYEFEYANADAGGTVSNYVPGKVLASSPFTRSAEAASDINTASRLLFFNGVSTGGAFPGAGFDLETANYTAGASGRFTGLPRILYTKRFTEDGWNVDWRDGSYWTFATSDLNSNGSVDSYELHDSRQPDAGTYPQAGDVAVVGWVPFTDTGTPAADRGKPHGISINRTEVCAELRFTQMLNVSNNPTTRIYASNFQFRPTVVINNNQIPGNVGQLGDGIVSGEGAFWIRSTGGNLSDPSFASVDLGAFVEEDSAYFIYESTLASATYNNVPSVMPNVLMATDGWGTQDKTSTITKDITVNGDLELLGDVNLALNTGAAGNITVMNDLKMFRSNAKGNDSGGGSELRYANSGTARTVTVYGDLKLGIGDLGLGGTDYAARIYINGADGTPLTHVFNLYGNFYQNTPTGATSGFQAGTSSANDRIHFNLLGNSSVVVNRTSGDAPQFYSITVNKGSSISTSATFNTNFTLSGPTNVAAKALTLSNGLAVINNASTDINLTTGGGDFSIPSTAGLEVRAGTVRVTGANTGILLDGLLRVSGGTVNMDAGAAINSYIEYSASGNAAIEVTSGTLTVGSQVRRSLTSTSGILKYTQSGGTVVIAKNAAPTTSRGVFEVLNTGSQFNHSGGSLTIVQGINSTTVPSIWLEPGSSTVTSGSTITIGNVNTPAGANNIGIQSTATLHNLTIAGSNSPTVKIYISPLTLNGSLTINASNTFNAMGQSLSINGDMTANGTFTSSSNTTTFTGSGTISGAASSLAFYNLRKTGSGTTILARDISITNDFELLAGTFNGQTFTATLLGNAKIDGTYTNTSGSGLYFGGTSQQLLQRSSAGTGTLGIVTIANNSGVRVPDATGYNFTINNGLRMVQGVFDISSSLLTLGQNATITPVNAFSITNMIQTNSSFTDKGVRKIFPANYTTDFTFPVGQLYYTPIRFNFSSSGYTSGSGTPTILVRPANEKHSSVLEDGEAPDPEIVDQNNVLQYHYIVNADNIATDFRADMILSYDQALVNVTAPYTEADYIAARILSDSNPTDAIDKYTSDDLVDENFNTITFSFDDVIDAGISGEYFAGVDDAIVDNVRTYTTVRSGNVNDGAVAGNGVTGGVYDVAVPGGGNTPNAAVIVVEAGHTLTFNASNVSLYRTEIKAGATLRIPDASIGHRLGNLIGQGTLLIESNSTSVVMPAIYAEDFFTCGGGSLTYDGTGSYQVMGGIVTVRNLTVQGTGTKTLANNDIIVCEDLTVNGPIFTNVSNNRSMSIGDDLIITNSGQFRTGNGAITVNDDVQQNSGAFVGQTTNLTVVSDVNIVGGTFTSGDAGTISIGGNLSVDGAATFYGSRSDGTGSLLYRFNGSALQSITGNLSGATSRLQQLQISNSAGLQLNGNVSVDEQLLLTSGNIFPQTNQFTLLSGGTVSPVGGQASSFVSGRMYKELSSGGGVSFIFPIGKTTRWRPASVNAPTVARTWNAEYFAADPRSEAVVDNLTPTVSVPAIVSVSTIEYWKVSDNTSPSTAQIGLSWGTESVVSANSAQREALKVLVWNDATSSWDNQGGGSFSAGHTQSAGRFVATTATTFSERIFTLGSTESANALPVTFLSFAGKTVAGRNMLTWETANEINNDYFTLEHSIDGETYTEIGTVKANGLMNQGASYVFAHNVPSIGRNYYKLRQTDLDGNYTYHPQVVYLLIEEESLNFEFDMYPNPLHERDLTIRIAKANTKAVTVRIYSLSGSVMYHQELESSATVEDLTLQLQHKLPVGLYIVEVSQGVKRMSKRLVIN